MCDIPTTTDSGRGLVSTLVPLRAAAGALPTAWGMARTTRRGAIASSYLAFTSPVSRCALSFVSCTLMLDAAQRVCPLGPRRERDATSWTRHNQHPVGHPTADTSDEASGWRGGPMAETYHTHGMRMRTRLPSPQTTRQVAPADGGAELGVLEPMLAHRHTCPRRERRHKCETHVLGMSDALRCR